MSAVAHGPTIQTERFLLRPLTIEDVEPLFEVLGDAETMRWYPRPFDRSGAAEWIERQVRSYASNGFGLLAVEDRELSEFLGDCGPTIQEVDGEDHVELGWHTRRDRWGQGIATEAGAACREWCFANLDVDHLISLIRPENRASWRVAQKIGMTIWKETVRANFPHQVWRIDRPA